MNTILEKAEAIAIEMKEKYEESIKSEIQTYSCHTNRASSIGEKCVRKLVYMRLNWKESAPIPPGLQKRFGEGNIQEPAIEDRLRKMGYNLIQKSQPIQNKKANITGTLDDCIALEMEAGRPKDVFPIEIKALTTFICKKVNKVEDFNNYGFAAKYLDQGTMYMHELGMDFMIFVIKDKDSGNIEFLPFLYDKKRAEGLINKGIEIDKHVKAKTYPDRIKNDPKTCEMCNFNHLCMPDKVYEGKELIVDDELQEKINRHQELEDTRKEYNSLHKELGIILKGVKGIAGAVEISGYEVKKDGYYVKPTQYWVMKLKG